MILNRAAVGVAVVAMLLSGCSAGDETDATGPDKTPAPATATAGATPTETTETATVFGDSKAELAVATGWTRKWCAVHDGDTRAQAVAAMGTPRPEGAHSLVWGDEHYEFGVKLDKQGRVVGHWDLHPTVTRQVATRFSCRH